MRTPLLGAVLTALLTFAAFAGQAAGSTDATAPRTGTITDTPLTVSDRTGDQTDPHIGGGVVSYTDQSNGGSAIHVYGLASGSDIALPSDGGMDFLSDTNGGKVVYTHLSGAGSQIRLYDTATGAVTDLAPSGVNLSEARIGGDTVVWQDFDYTGDSHTPELVAYDIATGTSTRLTDDLMLDKVPAVSPDGNTIVWTKCQPDATGCTIWEARKTAGGWTTDALTSTTDGEPALPDTDGRVVVYSTVSPSGDEDVYWQPVGGGTAHEVSMPGQQTNPNVSNGVIAFQLLDTSTQFSNYDIWAYDIATNTLYRVTDSLADETLADVVVSSDRQATVVWSAQRSDEDVLGASFALPPVPASLTLTPSDGNQDVGTQATVTATVEDESGNLLAGADVRFSTSGAVTTTGSCTTAADGTCAFAYDGPATAGTVDVAAFVDTNEDGAASEGEPAATATRDFMVVTDTTAPTVSVAGFTDGQLVLLGAPRPTPTCSSSDEGSGVASTTGPTDQDDLTANGVGTVSVTCTATDAAGNTGTATSTYRIGYAFGGFLAPVQSAPAVNTGHAGRAYPLTWQLTDANGGSISALSAVASIRYRAVACDGFSGEENSVDAAATGDTSLRYDASAEQFVYTWKTPRVSGCYALSATLDSGQELDAYFRLS